MVAQFYFFCVAVMALLTAYTVWVNNGRPRF